MQDIQDSPTMMWTNPPCNFRVSNDVVKETLSGLGVVDAQALTAATGATLIGGAVSMFFRGVAGYFAGKWSSSSKGWGAASAALFGVPGLAGSIYFTRKNKATANRRRRSRKCGKNGCK
jgi:hypothetical protein